MLKNSLNKTWFVYFQQFTLVRYAGYRRKRNVSLSGRPPNEFRPKHVLNSPYNQGYDPSSRNVYRKIKPKSDQYVFEELEDEVWKMERNNLDQKRLVVILRFQMYPSLAWAWLAKPKAI